MTDVEINIDMNKPCQQCGVMGAADSGLCMQCIADNAFSPEKLIQGALEASMHDIGALLVSHTPQIVRAYYSAEDHKLRIGVSIEMAPSNEMPNTIVARSKIDFIESRVRDEKTSRVSAQQDLKI